MLRISDQEFIQMIDRLNSIASDSIHHPGLVSEVKRYAETGVLNQNRITQIDKILSQDQCMSYDDWAIHVANTAIKQGKINEFWRIELKTVINYVKKEKIYTKISIALSLPYVNKSEVLDRISLDRMNQFILNEGSEYSPIVHTFNKYPETVKNIIETIIRRSDAKTELDMVNEVAGALIEKFGEYPKIISTLRPLFFRMY